MEQYIITFRHGNYAVATYNKLHGYGLSNIKLTQTPFSIRSECDLCIIAYNRDALNDVIKYYNGGFPIQNVYERIIKNGSFIYKLIQ